MVQDSPVRQRFPVRALTPQRACRLSDVTDDHSEGADLTATGAQAAAPTASEEESDPAMVPFAVAGLVIWAVIGLAMLPFRDRLVAAGHGSWLWTCLAGFLLGIAGLLVMIRHDAHRGI
jgi:hypothetical protein